MAIFRRCAVGSVALASLALAAGSAAAQQAAPASPIVVQGDKPAAAPQAAASPSAIDQADPLICERIQEIGSRLKIKKVCLTKSQWDAQKREDRMNIERSQVTRGVGP